MTDDTSVLSEVRWTPGPWHADAVNSWNVWSDDCKIAITQDVNQATHYREPSDEERIANANLIAAAPDLYEALLLLKRQMVALYRAAAPAGNYGANSADSDANGNTFADRDEYVLRAREALARALGTSDAMLTERERTEK